MRKNWVVNCEKISEKSVFQEHAKKGNVELISAIQSNGFRSANVIRSSEAGIQKLGEDLEARGITCCIEKFTSDDVDSVLAEAVNATLRLVGAVFHEDFERSLHAVSVKKFEGAMLGKIVTDPRDIAFFGIVGGLQIVEVPGGFPGAVPVEESDLIFRWFGFNLPPSAVVMKRDLLYHIRKCVVSGDLDGIRWVWKYCGQSENSLPGALSERMRELRDYLGSREKVNISVKEDRKIEDIIYDLGKKFEGYERNGSRPSARRRDLVVLEHLSEEELIFLDKRDIKEFGDLGGLLGVLRARWTESEARGVANALRAVTTRRQLKSRLARLIKYLGE